MKSKYLEFTNYEPLEKITDVPIEVCSGEQLRSYRICIKYRGYQILGSTFDELVRFILKDSGLSTAKYAHTVAKLILKNGVDFYTRKNKERNDSYKDVGNYFQF